MSVSTNQAKKKDNAEAVIKCRVTKEQKLKISALAKERGITMTELLLNNATGSNTRNRIFDAAAFSAVATVSKEMNHIGNNLNQVTLALHQINKGSKIEVGEYHELNVLLNQYVQSRETLKELLLGIQFNNQ